MRKVATGTTLDIMELITAGRKEERRRNNFRNAKRLMKERNEGKEKVMKRNMKKGGRREGRGRQIKST